LAQLTAADFFDRARGVHGDRYDYTETLFEGTNALVTVRCRIHGPFVQRADAHMAGRGCRDCAGRRRLTVNEWIERARSVHGDRYDYSVGTYRNAHTKVTIVCPEHGPFSQKPNGHLNGFGCPPCGVRTKGERRRTPFADFVGRARARHGDRYDYDPTGYWVIPGHATVICTSHGRFVQNISNHLKGSGCPRCARESVRNSQVTGAKRFIEQAVAKHGPRYDYSRVIYVNAGVKVSIRCPVHGTFEQKANDHLAGKGCRACAKKRQYTTEEFIELARARHGDRYDYSLADYVSSGEKVLIGCPDHGTFAQSAASHLYGIACPRCAESQGEREVRRVLETHDVEFVTQFSHPTLRDRGRLLVDFALPSRRVLIEFDGTQHRRPVQFGAMTQEEAQVAFKELVRRDNLKTRWAAENGWTLVRLHNKATVVRDLRAAGILSPVAVSSTAPQLPALGT
jgi:very-short-patch-repair endonuclease